VLLLDVFLACLLVAFKVVYLLLQLADRPVPFSWIVRHLGALLESLEAQLVDVLQPVVVLSDDLVIEVLKNEVVLLLELEVGMIRHKDLIFLVEEQGHNHVQKECEPNENQQDCTGMDEDQLEAEAEAEVFVLVDD